MIIMAPRASVVVSMVIAVLGGACGPQRVVQPSPPNQELFVLLPDPDGGGVGRVSVSSGGGTVELSAARSTWAAQVGHRPWPPHGQAELQQFGDVLSALPPPPRHFTLNFEFASEDLTGASRAVVPRLRVVGEWPVPMSSRLGTRMRRWPPITNWDSSAQVRDLCSSRPTRRIVSQVVSHGEGDPPFDT
jgi:hypothetical protein